MRHTKKKLVTLSIYALFMTAMYGGYVGSLSWFDNKSTIPQDYMGESANAFFGGGKGTKDEPYKISSARHFYNLCWLQYLGRFNKDSDDEDTVIDQVYFSLENDIDCSSLGSALPPIGTTRYPFVGNFNGNDHVISNYVITDEYSKLTKHPSIIDTETTYRDTNSDKIKYCSIIGTFGVIGYNTNSATDVDSSETSLYSFSTDQLAVNSVTNLYIDNVTIKPKTTNTLAGLLAGYVSANISGCGVHYSNLDFSNGATNISADKFNGKISNYTLIGDYNSTDYSWDGHSSGQNNDFGGSIDFASISKRVTYIIDNADSTSTDNSGKAYVSSKFNSKIYVRNSQQVDAGDYSWNAFKTGSTSLQTAFFAEGSYLPLNIDESTATIDGTATTMGSYYGDKNTTSEPIKNSNTGYLVGADSTTNATPRIQHRSGNAASGIPYSIATQDNNNNVTTSDVFDSSNLSFFYIDSDSKTKRIIDDDNKNTSFKTYSSNSDKVNASDLNFEEYSSVKNNFIDSLKKATDSSTLADGRITLNAILFNKSSNAQKTINKSGVKIKDGSSITISTYDNYAFLTGGLNFSLSKSGVMTFISANMTGSQKATLPPLLKLERSTDKSSIETKKQIYKIYQKNGTYEYTYNSTDTISDGTLVVDLYKMNQGNSSTGLFERYCAYYFEIPLTAGDYYFGADTSGSSYTYFLYLDIGANAGDSGGTSETVGTIKDVDWFYYDGTSLVKVLSDNSSKVVFEISGDGKAVFYFNRIKDIGILYFEKDKEDGISRTQPSTYSGTSKLAKTYECLEAAN